MTILLIIPSLSPAQEESPKTEINAPVQDEEQKRFDVEVELDAYYSNIDLFLSLTKDPIPQMGEKSEFEIYRTLLLNALKPRFLVLEGSVNPLPCLGVYIKEHSEDFYDRTDISDNFNLIKAVTAGFQEPYAASVFFGNVADFDVRDRSDIKGKAFSGFLFTAGNYHIKDNELISDQWREYELKFKGDTKSPLRKLSWSFRGGEKLHGNPDIADIVYLSFRRSRLDYRPEDTSIFNNSGFEYSFDMDNKTFRSIRHYFFVNKKWPRSKFAFSMDLGFVWESSKKYSGKLAAERGDDDFQFILRPNIEF